MAESKPSIHVLLSSLHQRLSSLGADYAGLSLRQKVLRLVQIYDDVKGFNASVARDSGCDSRSARERIRLYFLHNVGVALQAKELEVVSGISEYARRIRELRVEDGYAILTQKSNDPDLGLELKADQYILVRAEPNREAAFRWKLANRIRKDSSLNARGRILEFLKQNIGNIVTSEELYYVSGNQSEWARRTRELRTELGYAVSTVFTGRPDLKPGEYVLENVEPILDANLRDIPIPVQREVYARDNHTCRQCGWDRGLWTRQDPRYLEIHHHHRHAQGGLNTVENLFVVCSRCHDLIHAGSLKENFA